MAGKPGRLTRYHVRVRDDLAGTLRGMIKAGESLIEHPDESEELRAILRDAGAEDMAAKVKSREGVAFTLETFDDSIVALVTRIVKADGGDERTPLRGIEISLAPKTEGDPHAH